LAAATTFFEKEVNFQGHNKDFQISALITCVICILELLQILYSFLWPKMRDESICGISVALIPGAKIEIVPFSPK
jgi:hypothetical protein